MSKDGSMVLILKSKNYEKRDGLKGLRNRFRLILAGTLIGTLIKRMVKLRQTDYKT